MTGARSIMWLVLRSRGVRLAAGLCLVSALAFTLGQSAAAFHASMARQAATHRAPPTLERVSGAQGTTPLLPRSAPPESSAPPEPDAFSTGLHQAASAGQFEPQPGALSPKGPKAKDKSHPDKHGHDGKAAGDASHGGLSHGNGNGHSVDGGAGNDANAGNGNGSKGWNGSGSGHGADHQAGNDVGRHTGHGG